MFICHICNINKVTAHNKSGACMRCVLIHRNKGIELVHKPNFNKCKDCGCIIGSLTNSFLCKRCAWSGERHPLFGKHHSLETRAKISKNRRGKCIPEDSIKRGALNRSGSKHHAWNGGKFINKDGYRHILMPGHPNAYRLTGYVLEHRVIVEKYIGRILNRREDVHHIDSNRLNNSIFNLMVFSSRSAHRSYEEGKEISKEDIIFDGSKL